MQINSINDNNLINNNKKIVLLNYNILYIKKLLKYV